MISGFDKQEFLVIPTPCPACNLEFELLQVRTNKLQPVRRHSDFHVEYAGPSPTHYVVTVCPTCYYASYRSDFDMLHGQARERIQATAAKRKEKYGLYDFTEIRGYDSTQASYELALHCYILRKKTRYGLLAALYLHMAWLAREAGMGQREQHYLERSLENYRQSFTKDRSESVKDEIKQSYLAGDLALQLGEFGEAITWFEKTVNHPNIKEFPGLEQHARERWADARDAVRTRRY